MKRLLVVLLSLGLVMAFSMSAFAVSADFTGQYYVRQNYISNPSLLDQDKGSSRAAWADTDQRLRLFTRLKVVEGVTLTTRVDILESVWGREQSMMAISALNTTTALPAAGNSAKQMRDFNTGNASFEQLYLTFDTGIGRFIVGNKSGTPYQWGTWFLNNSGTAAGIYWTKTFGNYTVIADLAKTSKGDMSSKATGELVTANLGYMDKDRDYYDLAVQYKGKDLEGGLMASYYRWANTRSTAASSSMSTALFLVPYFKAKLGAVDLEGEAYYTPMGKLEYDNPSATNKDQNYKAKGIYLQGKFNMGAAWAGASVMYTSGADPTAAPGDDITGTVLSSFGYATDNYSEIWSDYVPVILYGTASDTLHSYLPSGGVNALGQTYDNLWLYNIKAGVAVGKKLSFDGKVSLIKADKVAAGWDDKIGTELDLRGTYKIYDCLTYNVGLAYLWTGDYFKGTVATTPVANTYFVSHWLNLRF